MDVLKVKNVYKNYTTNKKNNVEVLKNISLSLGENQFVSIMGASGSGKTTLLNIASGIDKCNAGEVYILDKNICEMKRNDLSVFRRNNIGMVFQDFNLIESLTVKENIMVPLILDKQYEVMESNKIDELSNMLNINELMDRYPNEISGGQKQRVAICRAIINNPKIIFADEPTGNLDSKSSEDILSYFELLHKKYNTTILMVTHEPFAASYCDKVVFLEDGIIIKELVKKDDKEIFFNEIMTEMQEFNSIRIKNNK